MNDAEVIVVGGGHNGLICAAYLARAGVQTVLLEARDSVGGCASTVNDLGARFNICACDHSLIRAMPLIDELDLVHYGLDYLEPEATYVNTFHDNMGSWVFYHDHEQTIEGLSKTHPSEVDNYKRYLKDSMPVANLAIEIAKTGVSLKEFLQTASKRRMRGASRLLRWSKASALDVFNEYFDDWRMYMPGISTGPTVWGAPPEAPGTGLAATVYATRHLIASGRPRKGSGSLPDAILRSFLDSGGKVHVNSVVEKLIIEQNRVRAVQLQNGNILKTPKVIAACDPHRVLLNWVDEAPVRSKRVFDRWRNEPSPEGYESKIDGIIERLPQYKFMTEFSGKFDHTELGQSTVVISPSPEKLAEAHKLKSKGEISDKPTMLASVPSVLDPEMKAQNGLHTFGIEVLFTPYSLKGGWTGSEEPKKWLDIWGNLAEGNSVADITKWRAMTPDVYERDFFMSKGHSPGYAASPLATLVGKNKELSRYRTPIKGLFLTGAATFPGAGIFGAPGANTAKVLIKSPEQE